MVGKHRGDDFLWVCVYLRDEPLSRFGQKIIPGSFAVSGGAVAFIHSQTAAYIVHLIAVATTATPFASPSSPIHSLSARTYAPSFSLAHSHLTHLTHAHRHIPKGAMPLLQQ